MSQVFDLSGEHRALTYKLLAGLVTPRPIALTTTIDEYGRVNAAPISFFNVVGANPATVILSPGNRPDNGEPKDTARNIEANREFVVNLIDEPLAEAMNLCASPLPFGESELDLAGLTTAPSIAVAPPRIAECPVALECSLWDIARPGNNRIVIGEVLRLHVADGLLTDQHHVIREAWNPIGRMEGPDGYTRTNDRFDLRRP